MVPNEVVNRLSYGQPSIQIKRSRLVVRKDDGRYNIPTPSDTLSKLRYGTNMVLNGTK